jgi:hypothetical protein
MKLLCCLETGISTRPNEYFFITPRNPVTYVSLRKRSPYFERSTSTYDIGDLQQRIMIKVFEAINLHCDLNNKLGFYDNLWPYLALEVRRSGQESYCSLGLVLNEELVWHHWQTGVLPPSFCHSPLIKRYLERVHTEFELKVKDNYFPQLWNEQKGDGVINVNHSVTPLFSHQAEGVRWMLQLEDKISRQQPVGHVSLLKPVIDHNLFWDASTCTLTEASSQCEKDDSTSVALYSQGGMIGDGIGSGKTLMMLNLIVHTTAAAAAAAPAVEGQKLEETKGPPVVEEAINLRTQATLVVCGKQLAEQWKTQFEQHFKNKALKVVLLTDKLHHERSTYNSLCQAHVIIVTMSFLTGDYYRLQFLGQRLNVTLINDYPSFLATKWPTSMQHKPVLELLQYKRIVLDEADMYLSKLPYMDPVMEYKYQRKLTQHCRVNCSRATEPFVYVNLLQSTFKWLVTSTPDLHELSQQAAFASFLNLSTLAPPSFQPGPVKPFSVPRTWNNVQKLCLDVTLCGPSGLEAWIFKQAFVQHLLLARSQEYVFQSMALPDLEMDVIWIDFSTAEQNLVNSALEVNKDYDARRHTHAFPLFADEGAAGAGAGAGAGLTIAEATAVMTQSQRQRIAQLESTLQTLRSTQDEVQNVNLNLPAALMGALNLRQSQIGLEIRSTEESLRASQRSLHFLESAVQNTSDPCIICLEGQTTMVTPCGHKFCGPCLRQALQNRPVCPACRAQVQLDRCITFTPATLTAAASSTEYGSRFEALRNYVTQVKAEDPTAQFVVFSEWDKELKKQATLLSTEAGLRCAQIKGNTSTCSHHVQQFKNKEVDVIFLSLQSMASGLNLETANHVVLLTPLGQPFDRACQIERQAIGRCHRVGQTRMVHVRHILVRNSLEQEIYEEKCKYLGTNNLQEE